jgi:DNA repair protein RadA/Sms
MKKSKKQFVCSSCGFVSHKWAGQCQACGEWDSFSEEFLEKESKASIVSALNVDKTRALEVDSLDGFVEESSRIITPIGELNRVLGGGIVPGSVILIGGDPGIGKSTILLQLSMNLSNHNVNCFYVTGEESANQVKLRASRLNGHNSNVKLLSATNVNSILATIETIDNLDLVIIDSIQTVYSEDFPSTPGTVTQIRQCTQMLLNFAKKRNIALIVVGHVTKDGELAGPKILEHMVDTVLYLEGDQNNQYRILRSVKNRFGGVNEIGVFEMTSFGLNEVTNPSELFLMERENNVSGSAIFAGIEGSRPILVEIQALISPSFIPTPRRSAVGWDQNRLSMILAVLGVRYGLNLSNKDVYLSVTGGLKINEPASDLAVSSALISAAYDRPLPNNSVFFGEVGLSGEVRKVNQADSRIKEVLKQGYNNIYCSIDSGEYLSKVKTIKHISQIKSIFRES